MSIDRNSIIEECAKVAEDATMDPGIKVHTAAHGPLCSAHTPGIIADRIRALAEPFERTPETVLRAMLRAYDTQAESRAIEFFGCDYDHEKNVSYEHASNLARIVRECLYYWIAGNKDPMVGEPEHIRADYEARLSGQRSLDAPPMEEP